MQLRTHGVLAAALGCAACSSGGATDRRDVTTVDTTAASDARGADDVFDAGHDGAAPADAVSPLDAALPADAASPADAGCALGSAASGATSGALDLFGTPVYFHDGQPLEPGRYRVRYVGGCMKYGGGQGWTVNAYAAEQSCWYLVGESTSDRVVVPPGAVGYQIGAGGYENFADCVAASRAVAPVEFTLTAAKRVGVWLLDSPYSDNMAGENGENPRWELERVGGACGDAGVADAGGG